MRAGRLQRARKTPMTMLSDTTTGDKPSVTSFVGASAAPSHAPAERPQRIPTACNVRKRRAAGEVSVRPVASFRSIAVN